MHAQQSFKERPADTGNRHVTTSKKSQDQICMHCCVLARVLSCARERVHRQIGVDAVHSDSMLLDTGQHVCKCECVRMFGLSANV